jgi:hypothetical protein
MLMKRSSVVRVVLGCALVFALGLSSRGGADGSAGTGTAPRIDKVIMYRLVNGVQQESLEFWIGDQMTFRIYAYDRDRDISQVVMARYHPVEATVPYHPVTAMPLPSQDEAEVILFPVGYIDNIGPAGSWRIEFYLIDSTGNESDVWTTFILTHP